jgi:hypothetical protein
LQEAHQQDGDSWCRSVVLVDGGKMNGRFFSSGGAVLKMLIGLAKNRQGTQ